MHTEDTPHADGSMDAASVIDAMPEGSSTLEALLNEVVASFPPDIPPPVAALLRRMFLTGAGEVLDQIAKQVAHPETVAGDPTRLIALLNGLGVGRIVLYQREIEIVEREAREIATKRGKRVITIHQEH